MEVAKIRGLTQGGKENAAPTKHRTDGALPQATPRTQNPPQQSVCVFARDYPQTPIGRLPLAELIASGEDLNHVLNLTPVERVLWGTSTRTSDHGSSQETPALPRSRKRAHSSSPASSSQKDNVSQHFAVDYVPVQIQNAQQALRTPQGDPASDLWNRYSLNIQSTEKQSPTRINGRPFSQLINSSSPQTPAQALIGRESAGLRRSFSCGTEWPTSAAKRRKLQHNPSPQKLPEDLDIIQQPVMRLQKSRSRLSLLVDKIHGDLARPSPDNPVRSPTSAAVPASQSQEDSISHPTLSPEQPAQEHFQIGSSLPAFQNEIEDASVLEARLADNNSATNVLHSDIRMSPPDIEDQVERNPDGNHASSEFGDDDIDLEMFVDADTTVSRTQALDETPQKPRIESGEPGFQILHDQDQAFIPSDEQQLTLRKEHLPGALSEQNAAFKSEPDDEFDDDANEVSVEDLEDAIALFDSQHNEHCATKPVLQDQQAVNAQFRGDTVHETKTENIGNPSDIGSTNLVENSSDDEFGGDVEFEEVIAECNGTRPGQPVIDQDHSNSNRNGSTIQRFVIMTVAEGEYLTNNGQSLPEKVLLVREERTKSIKAITLRQSWVDTPCLHGAHVHLIGEFDRFGQCIVDDAHHLLILHPDHLVSATVVADSFSCTRRAVLQDRVKVTGDSSEPQVYGSILHEIFQEAMKANRWDDQWLTSTIENITNQYLEKLFEINVEVHRAVDHLKSRVIQMQSWAEVFVANKPKAQAIIKDRNGAQVHMSIRKLLDVEEKIWSPKYGLKGMIDATVQATMQTEEDEKQLIVPFEVKTGKNSTAAHKAQTALYTLLCSDRYDLNVACGILYYMEISETSRIPAIRHELIHMIKQRNELAGFIRQKSELPPLLNNSPHLCGKCYAQKTCFIYHKLVDSGNGDTSGLKEMFDELVKHLQPVHQQFFTLWDTLLTKEEKDVIKVRRELWTLPSTERERLGRCFANVVIEAGSYIETADSPKINRYRYSFIKQKPQPSFSFTESQMTLGEPIVISDENGHFALASGYVTSVRKHKLQVTVDRRLHNARCRTKGFNAQDNQSFVGIMEVAENGTGQSTHTPSQPQEEVLYRIDKDEFSNGMATVRNNLISLMEKDAFNAQPLRRLIVENVDPVFRPPSATWRIIGSASQANLNVDQQRAIEKVMSAKDYALVLGMPGTGKTTTIAHIIRALTAQGKSVLLTSYTHTAVDNILLKIRKDSIGIFRIGAVSKVHPEVQEFADLGGKPMRTIEELKRAYGQQVVATTCLGINHPIFTQRIFDYCIVDEASQITLPVCLGPIRMARTFILVGDHYQLPPLVQNKEAQEGGLDISLFKMLSDRQPSSVVNLEHQYRMCENIMTLSNSLIYNGRLKCGTQSVAEQSLIIPNMIALKQHHHNPGKILTTPQRRHICQSPTRGSCWLRDLLDPTVKACFVNTDPLLPASREAETGSRTTNPFEAALCQQLVEGLITIGISRTDIGVITLYRSQLALIKHNLRHKLGIEMHTADKFQGRDKEVVVLSLVRSNESGNVGELLKDWRRVNVALTRARTKLLVLGSKKTLSGNELLKAFVDLMEERGWSYDLPPGALESHLFDDDMTQISGGRSSGASRDCTFEADIVDGKQAPAVGKQNREASSKKIPSKKATMSIRALLAKRPVLRDITNDMS